MEGGGRMEEAAKAELVEDAPRETEEVLGDWRDASPAVGGGKADALIHFNIPPP
jgi:hypothetical protein